MIYQGAPEALGEEDLGVESSETHNADRGRVITAGLSSETDDAQNGIVGFRTDVWDAVTKTMMGIPARKNKI